MGQAKMAKSAGNVLTIQDLVDAGHDPLAFRYLCFTARYRRQVGLTDDALGAAATALRRLRERIAALGRATGAPAQTDDALRSALSDETALAHHARFVSAIEDDLDFPAALKVLQDALADERVAPMTRLELASSWDNVLGLDLAAAAEVDDQVLALIRQRDDARSARDFTRADAIRDELKLRGVELIDTPGGTRWLRS
jgi:cysteinyl-tRNA synthetase